MRVEPIPTVNITACRKPRKRQCIASDQHTSAHVQIRESSRSLKQSEEGDRAFHEAVLAVSPT